MREVDEEDHEPLDAGGTNPVPGGDDFENGRESLGFHYSRERRLEHAPENVRRAYREGYTPNKGFLKGLTANAGLKSILAVIVILCALIGFLTITDIPGAITIGEIPMRSKAFAFEDKIYFTLTCEESKKLSGSAIPVTVEVSVVDAENNVLDSRELSGLYAGTEILLRTVLRDEGSKDIRLNVTAGNAKRAMAITVDRK